VKLVGALTEVTPATVIAVALRIAGATRIALDIGGVLGITHVELTGGNCPGNAGMTRAGSVGLGIGFGGTVLRSANG
jgi:hypothetical protein